MASAVVLLCFAHSVRDMGVALANDVCVDLLRMMALPHNIANDVYKFLKSLMKEKKSWYVPSNFIIAMTIADCMIIFFLCRDLVTESLNGIMVQFINKCSEDFTIHLLKALPLLHFLRGDCTPYEELVCWPTDMKWREYRLDFAKIRSTIEHKKGSAFSAVVISVIHAHKPLCPRFIEEHYKELEPLFPLDPLLMFVVADVCPADEVSHLCSNISLPYAIALVAKKLDYIQPSVGNTKVSLIPISSF